MSVQVGCSQKLKIAYIFLYLSSPNMSAPLVICYAGEACCMVCKKMLKGGISGIVKHMGGPTHFDNMRRAEKAFEKEVKKPTGATAV